MSIGSHSSVGPQFRSPTPMQIWGKFSRKTLVKCSFDSTTQACTSSSCLLADPLQNIEEADPLLLGRRLPGGRHHRRVRQAVGER